MRPSAEFMVSLEFGQPAGLPKPSDAGDGISASRADWMKPYGIAGTRLVPNPFTSFIGSFWRKLRVW